MQHFSNTSPLTLYINKHENNSKRSPLKPKYPKAAGDYVSGEKTENVQENNISRSISLNKPPASRQKVVKTNNFMGSTHFGQGFIRGRKGNEKIDMSPYSQHETNKRHCAGSMNKTANNWNTRIRSRLLKEKAERDQELRSSRSKHEENTHLPSINKNFSQFSNTNISGINDAYISYVANNKQSRSFISYKKKEKKQLNKSELIQESEVKAFNWEGIHFEVIPKRENSLTSINNLQSNYKTDMNLMVYNFNNSTTIPIHNKTLNDFNKSRRRANINRSPLVKCPSNTEEQRMNHKKQNTALEQKNNLLNSGSNKEGPCKFAYDY